MTRPSRAETLTVPTADFSCMSENKVKKSVKKKRKISENRNKNSEKVTPK